MNQAEERKNPYIDRRRNPRFAIDNPFFDLMRSCKKSLDKLIEQNAKLTDTIVQVAQKSPTVFDLFEGCKKVDKN